MVSFSPSQKISRVIALSLSTFDLYMYTFFVLCILGLCIFVCMYFCIVVISVVFVSYIFVLFRYFVRFLLCGLSLSPSQKIFRVRALPSQHFNLFMYVFLDYVHIFVCMYFCILVISVFFVSYIFVLFFRYFVWFLLCGISLSPSQKILWVRALPSQHFYFVCIFVI